MPVGRRSATGVEFGAGGPDPVRVGLGLGLDRDHHRLQLVAERGEGVVDLCRHRRGHRAGQQAVALQRAQGLGEQILTDPGDPASEVLNEDLLLLQEAGVATTD